jgi:UDP-N-acetylmuramate--alanine ligase
VHYLPTLKDVQAFLVQNLQSGDLAVFLGAGNLNQAITPTIQELTH